MSERESIGGVPVSEEQIAQWAAEAEVGYDVPALKKRGRGRPGRGAEPSQVVALRLTAEELAFIDARAEGTQALYQSSALLPGVPLQTAFALMWCERYGAHAWAANPWVWVVEYRRSSHDEAPAR